MRQQFRLFGSLVEEGGGLRGKVMEIIKRHANHSSILKQQPQGQLPSIDITIKSINTVLLDGFASFILKTRDTLGGRGPGIKGIPPHIQRWSVLSSPHVHKTAFTQFEKRVEERSLRVDGLTGELSRRMIWYLKQNIPPDVTMECHFNEPIPLQTLLEKTQ